MKTAITKNKFGNPVCPYCKMVLTEQCFVNGKWQCRKCEKLLDYEIFKAFYRNLEELEELEEEITGEETE